MTRREPKGSPSKTQTTIRKGVSASRHSYGDGFDLCGRFQTVTDNQTTIPNVAEILAGVLRNMEPKLQPFLLAKLERLAAQRYRTWASDHPDQSVKEGLLACADREEEIATRVESLVPDASAIQDKLLSDHPELLDLNRTLFEGRPLKVQFAMQAEGERAGAAAWRAYAAGASDPSVRELLQSCSALEQANADFLQTLL
jgi:hypothetical protein